jgi:hypothetical protein
MTRLEKVLCWGAVPLLSVLILLITWPPGDDRGAMAELGQSVSALYAVVAALLIASNDRRRQDDTFREDRLTERRAFARRRDYEEAAKLLQFVEADRQFFATDQTSKPRSPGAAALILATWPKRNWWGRAVDYYVESLRHPSNRYANEAMTIAEFDLMQREIIDAVMKLDHIERE